MCIRDRSIAAMMDIAPDYANIERDGAIVEVDPDEVQVCLLYTSRCV